MKEISVKELVNYINPFELKEKPAIAVASDGIETNGLTIGWAGFGVLWRKPMATVYIHKTRYSKHIFDKAMYYSICFMDNDYKNQLGYFGRVSGRNENKMEKCGMTVIENDVAPYFEESSVVILCKMMGKSDFDKDNVDENVFEWYQNEGVHSQYYGEIIKVLVKD